MHDSSYAEMNVNINRYLGHLFDKEITIADIGSMDVNGTYKKLLPKQWKYSGIDQVAGKNVDVVMTGEFTIPLPNESFDVIISGQCIEHCTNPFKLIQESTRILKSGGFMLLVAPFIFSEHRYPVDCFRFLPDGMKAIFNQAGIETIAAYRFKAHVGKYGLQQEDCWGIGKKL